MIRYIASTRSTNGDLVARLAGDGRVQEGEWLIADRQTAGVGRAGRIWHDGAGNFMGSTAVRLRPGDPQAHTLALAAGLALHAAVAESLAAPPGAGSGSGASALPAPLLKWPNDLMVGNAKLAGILLERQGDAVIVGIGVNLLHAPSLDGRATIALAQIGAAIDRDVFAERLAFHFALDRRRWRDFGLAPIVRRWLAAAHPQGTPLTVDGVNGRFAGLADDGALRIRLGDGTERKIGSGEVRLREEAGT